MIGIGSLKTGPVDQSVPVAEEVTAVTHFPFSLCPVNGLIKDILSELIASFKYPVLPAERICPGSTVVTYPLFPGCKVKTGKSVTAGYGRIYKELII